MAAVSGSAANVVDRARALGDQIWEAVGVSERRRDEPHGRRGGAERGSQLATVAVDLEGERADGDHHRVPRADLHERLPAMARLDSNADDELVGGERVLLHAEK